MAGASLSLDTPARRRLAAGLLAWGQPRPTVAPELIADLHDQLEDGFASLGEDLQAAAAQERRGRVLVTKTRMDRQVCDGLQLDPRPFEYTRASVRGILAHAVIERDWDLDRQLPPRDVVGEVWQGEASRRPGDPASLSAWMNAQTPDEAAELRDELVELAEGFREVWPRLPPGVIDRRAEKAHQVTLAGGLVQLFGRPDLVLHSRRKDDRARALVVDLKTGRPRSEHDRHELRFYALLVTLATGVPPFRWATYYVTEGRYEAEDLRADTLMATARRVVDTAGQLVRLAAFGEEVPEEALRLRGGGWCYTCLREADCEVAAEARARHAVSQPDAIM